MRTGRPKAELVLNDAERSQLQSFARSRSLPAALSSRPRWHMHFIPTYSSWLNQVERFFALITDKAIRRGSFTSVKQLVERIDQFVTHHNANCQRFQWTATADSILEKLHRLCSRISGTGL